MNFTRRRTELEHVTPFDVSSLEQEIRDTMPTHRNQALLEQPQVTAEDIGRITAEAIATAHEAAATALTELGKELADRMSLIDQLKIDAEAALKDCLDTAQRYRDAGVKASEQIKTTSALTAEVRDTCDAMRKKIGEA